jgi:hypothetical protein
MDNNYELFKKLGLSVARGVPQIATGVVDLAALPLTMTGIRKPEQIFGSTAYLTDKGLLPQPQTGLLNQSTELASSMLNPAAAAKGGLGLAGIMIGKGAKTWDAVKAAQAEEMLAKGADPKEVWSLLGIGRATWDNQLRQEISDDAAKFKYQPIYDIRNIPRNDYNKLGDFLDHPKLYEAHPELRETKVEFEPKPFKDKKGNPNILGASYNNPLDRVRLEIFPPNYSFENNIDPKDLQNILNNTLHETNHAVQFRNDFGRGGSSSLFPQSSADKKLTNQIKQANALHILTEKHGVPLDKLPDTFNRVTGKKLVKGSMDLFGQYDRSQLKTIYNDIANQDIRKYKRIGGEAEARLVERRQPLTEQQRLETYPFQYLQGNPLTLDYPTNELVNRNTSGTIENFDLLNSKLWKN